MRRLYLVFLLMIFASAGCADCGGEDPPIRLDAGEVNIENTVVYADAQGQQQVVVIGDTAATGYGLPLSQHFLTLLLNNDDGRYPDDEGQDLVSLRPGSESLNLAVAGSRAEDVLHQQIPNIPENASVIIVLLGAEDFLDSFGDDSATGQDAATAFAEQFRQILLRLSDPTRFVALPYIYVVNILDDSDGEGDWSLSPQSPNWDDGEEILQAFNSAIVQELQQFQGVQIVDAHAAFLGHGAHHADSSNPYYDSQDPIAWIQDDGLRLSAAGHHHLRKLLFQALFSD